MSRVLIVFGGEPAFIKFHHYVQLLSLSRSKIIFGVRLEKARIP